MELSIAELRALTTPNVQAELVACESNVPLAGSKTKIVICQRGWVFVGQAERNGSEITIHNAKNIRQWGTTRGLGELAMSGPTNATKMDDYGTGRVHELSVVAMLDCDDGKWGA